MSDVNRSPRRREGLGTVHASAVSVACLLRGLPLLFREAPKTPLRVLCLVALDTLHVLRHARPLGPVRTRELATFLDFQACTNAAWDGKALCETEYQAMRERLEASGQGPWIDAYLSRLRDLERGRPATGGDRRRFDDVRSYREEVARLSLATVAAIALNAACLEEEIRATRCDADVETLFRIVMQCQIIDDVLDYAEDVSAGLPSFLTASGSLPQAVEWTAGAARSYAARSGCSPGNAVFPLRVALRAAAAVTQLVVRGAVWRHRHARTDDDNRNVKTGDLETCRRAGPRH